ncbi:hypothetical protein ACJ73_02782 [Blastomyces percursus]|uniref:Uncharacterized protein n=1 Tax=Blastomyces percursus TaxID=1658174 RepID=A0A1J9QAI0_9EURO|nr:hypothetical protein ACJ73_02782 [Blastomyces percursus]
MLEDINPPHKRLKRTGSPGSYSSNVESGSDVLPLETRIPPSETEAGYNDDYGIDHKSGAEDYLPNSQTALETAILPIKTDNEAIAGYEISKVQEKTTENGATTLHHRYAERKWVKGKSSIYVDAFNLALETVLEDEAHLFDETEMASDIGTGQLATVRQLLQNRQEQEQTIQTLNATVEHYKTLLQPSETEVESSHRNFEGLVGYEERDGISDAT